MRLVTVLECRISQVLPIQAMPARKPLPDLGGVDPAELQLEIMAILEQCFGPKTRTLMARMQFGDLLDYAGGARSVLTQALARIRQRGSAEGIR